MSDIGTFLVNNPQFQLETTLRQRKTARFGRAVDWSSQSKFQEKCVTVFRPELRKNKEIGMMAKGVKRFSGDIMPT
ncbi:hypothetical protein [Mesorhizobium sp. B2-8-3]|uniref:hypothetical protein n=1 Tax=Mesorhizobium sp. B2-8-3 TaxID=2589905 RepID=UPI0011275395|nr:hypothetical protein [Mesorhizobium sp. B2-8-3]TPJ35430.1 hypothetical protein FJ418_05280 [Mesorhizobium sp. B2-8-3]